MYAGTTSYPCGCSISNNCYPPNETTEVDACPRHHNLIVGVDLDTAARKVLRAMGRPLNDPVCSRYDQG